MNTMLEDALYAAAANGHVAVASLLIPAHSTGKGGLLKAVYIRSAAFGHVGLLEFLASVSGECCTITQEDIIKSFRFAAAHGHMAIIDHLIPRIHDTQLTEELRLAEQLAFQAGHSCLVKFIN